MAEAAVEERVPQRFYCHMCNIKFESSSSNYTCPQCSDGFVEQLESNGGGGLPGDGDDIFMSDSDDDNYQMLSLGNIDFLSFQPEERQTGRARYSADPNRRRRYAVHQHRIRPRPLSRPMAAAAASNVRHQATFENLIQEFIVNLGVGVNVMGSNGNMQLFLGNPGDYAWGREGLDAIVTQLLNQMDTTGPPPLAKDVIDAIPVVEVSEEQVASKLQCSVCWEDFQLNEKVRQLACLHVYHEPCIRPWLELHGTCPICRQDLGNGDQPNGGNNDTSGGNAFNTLQQLFQVVHNQGGGGGNIDVSSTDSSGVPSSDSSGVPSSSSSSDSNSEPMN